MGKWKLDANAKRTGCRVLKLMPVLIQKGEMFVALEAERDGHDYIDQAMKNGACPVLVNRPTRGFRNPSIKSGRYFESISRDCSKLSKYF